MSVIETTETPAILIVDDAPLNLVYLERLLRDLELTILKAESGRAALEIIEQQDVALVVLDVLMPEMDGYETADRIRQTRGRESTPIIFLTAAEKEQANVFRGYQSGAVDYLLKPVDPAILKCKVQVFCELFLQRRQIESQNELLEKRLSEIRALQGLIPICPRCKKIRNDGGYWEAIDTYMRSHADIQFSHAVCPDCTADLYPDLVDD